MKYAITFLFCLTAFNSWSQYCPGEPTIPGQNTHNLLTDFQKEIKTYKEQDRLKYQDSNVEPEWLELSYNDRFYELSQQTLNQLKWQVKPPLSNLHNPVLKRDEDFFKNLHFQKFITDRAEVLNYLDLLSKTRDAAIFDGEQEDFLFKQIETYQFAKSLEYIPLVCRELEVEYDLVIANLDKEDQLIDDQFSTGEYFTPGTTYQVMATYNRVPPQPPTSISIEVNGATVNLKVTQSSGPKVFYSENIVFSQQGTSP